MNPKAILLLVICMAAIAAAGCMTSPPAPAGTPAIPASPLQTIPSSAVSPVPAAECTNATDCVPAGCCHPTGCTAVAVKKPCNLMCTEVCEGPLDCGAGSCGCVQGKCTVIPAAGSPGSPALTSLAINASPSRYSPVMSSTPGVRLEPVPAGFSAADASFAWKADYGHFLTWNAPDYQVREQGDSVTSHGEPLYWSFIDRTNATATPVTITVTATDTASGRLLGSSVTTLDWTDNYSVIVRGQA